MHREKGWEPGPRIESAEIEVKTRGGGGSGVAWDLKRCPARQEAAAWVPTQLPRLKSASFPQSTWEDAPLHPCATEVF